MNTAEMSAEDLEILATKKRIEEEKAALEAARAAELVKRKEDAVRIRKEQEVSHQLSWLKNTLSDLQISDDVLRDAWLTFRSSVGCP